MEVYWATVKLANVGLSAQPSETPGRNTVNNVVMRSAFAEAGRDRVFFLCAPRNLALWEAED